MSRYSEQREFYLFSRNTKKRCWWKIHCSISCSFQLLKLLKLKLKYECLDVSFVFDSQGLKILAICMLLKIWIQIIIVHKSQNISCYNKYMFMFWPWPNCNCNVVLIKNNHKSLFLLHQLYYWLTIITLKQKLDRF